MAIIAFLAGKVWMIHKVIVRVKRLLTTDGRSLMQTLAVIHVLIQNCCSKVYKPRGVKNILEVDFEGRKLFCHTICDNLERDPTYLLSFKWSDEAIFTHIGKPV